MGKLKKAEVGTIVMVVMLLLVSVVGIASSTLFTGKKTTSTKAEEASCAPGNSFCGSGSRFYCALSDSDPKRPANNTNATGAYENGCDISSCPQGVEFNCCVANPGEYHGCSEDEYSISWYGCTGQYCSNTVIKNRLGYLVSCSKYGFAKGESERCVPKDGSSSVGEKTNSESGPGKTDKNSVTEVSKDGTITGQGTTTSSSSDKNNVYESMKTTSSTTPSVKTTPVPTKIPVKTPTPICRNFNTYFKPGSLGNIPLVITTYDNNGNPKTTSYNIDLADIINRGVNAYRKTGANIYNDVNQFRDSLVKFVSNDILEQLNNFLTEATKAVRPKVVVININGIKFGLANPYKTNAYFTLKIIQADVRVKNGLLNAYNAVANVTVNLVIKAICP